MAEEDKTKAPLGRRIARNGIRVLAGLAIGLAIAEGAFYFRDGGAFPHLNIYVEDADRGVRLRPGATERISFSNNPISSVRVNSEGYRGAEWPAAAPDEVVVVGDSQVFGLGVEEGETFSAALQSALGDKRIVRNLGVPTYGPREYNAALEEALAKRPAKTVIYTVNLANDLFEANRPNKDRHAVWDGWAVRKETAPTSVSSYPGRSFLYTRSHAFYALRRWWYERGPKVEDRGFASEGTWQDIGEATGAAGRERETAKEENDRVARLRKNELESVTDSAEAVHVAVERRVIDMERQKEDFADYDESKGGLPKYATYEAGRLSPGDIVTVYNGESSRGVTVNAEQIRRGAALRVVLEKEARKKAEAERDEHTIALFKRRSELDSKVATLKALPPPVLPPLSPLTPALRAAKAICDKHGARLLVVALPIDVQVSPKEWAKYGAEPLDMEPTKVLIEDVVVAARAVGAEGLDATPALAAAEPGAFLYGDLHMTAKGHKALGEAIATALRAPPPPPRVEVARPVQGLPAGRSYPPRPEEWTPQSEIAVRESDPAGCATKVVREWVGIFCRDKGGAKGVAVSSGTEVMAGTVPGASFLIAPAVRGQDVRATFVFASTTRTFFIKSPEGPESAVIEFGKPLAAAPVPVVGPEVETFCTCFTSKAPAAKCASATSVPDVDCARSYATDCTKLLECASGNPASPPVCAAGSANAGAAGRCHPVCSAQVPCARGTCTEWQGEHVCM